MEKKIETLIQKFREIYNGDPWYGDSMISILNKIDKQKVFVKIKEDFNSIAEVLVHVIAYREFLLKKLQGDFEFDVNQLETFNWKRIDNNEKSAWKSLLNYFDKIQNDIINELKKLDDNSLKDIIGKRKYNMEYLIEGIIQHDVYHLGQIAIINKMLKTL